MTDTLFEPPDATKTDHPAVWGDLVLMHLALLLEPYKGCGDALDTMLLDPFAGTGRTHLLRKHGWQTYGVEIEPEWAAMSPYTYAGDSTELPHVLEHHFLDGIEWAAIVTSPPWGNGMGQRSPHSNDLGQSKRFTYADALGRRLTANNIGAYRWGDAYRLTTELVWAHCVNLLAPGGLMVVNNRDSTRTGTIQPVNAWHINTLQRLGLELGPVVGVSAQGVGVGAFRNQVGNAELLMCFHKP